VQKFCKKRATLQGAKQSWRPLDAMVAHFWTDHEVWRVPTPQVSDRMGKAASGTLLAPAETSAKPFGSAVFSTLHFAQPCGLHRINSIVSAIPRTKSNAISARHPNVASVEAVPK